MIKSLSLVFLLLIFASCSSNQVGFSAAKEHMIESEKLTLLLHELDMTVYERFKSELEKDDIRQRYAMSLANTLKGLVKRMEETMPESLEKKDVNLYNGYVKELEKKANDIEVTAKRYELEKLKERLSVVQITCNDCHKRFRSY